MSSNFTVSALQRRGNDRRDLTFIFCTSTIVCNNHRDVTRQAFWFDHLGAIGDSHGDASPDAFAGTRVRLLSNLTFTTLVGFGQQISAHAFWDVGRSASGDDTIFGEFDMFDSLANFTLWRFDLWAVAICRRLADHLLALTLCHRPLHQLLAFVRTFGLVRVNLLAWDAYFMWASANIESALSHCSLWTVPGWNHAALLLLECLTSAVVLLVIRRIANGGRRFLACFSSAFPFLKSTLFAEVQLSNMALVTFFHFLRL